MTDTWDDDDRAIARALGVDAPDGMAPDGMDDVDAGAVAEYETVLGALPFEPVAPRPELEHEVVAAALARRAPAARAITSAPAQVRRSVSVRWVAIAATAAAAAAIAVALAVGVPGPEPGAPGAQIAQASATDSVAKVLAEQGTRTAVLRGPSGATAGRVALGADGQGYLYDLTPAAGDQARWLWLDTAGDQVLVGRLPETRTVHIVVRGDIDAVMGVFVTAEQGTPTVPGAVLANATFT